MDLVAIVLWSFSLKISNIVLFLFFFQIKLCSSKLLYIHFWHFIVAIFTACVDCFAIDFNKLFVHLVISWFLQNKNWDQKHHVKICLKFCWFFADVRVKTQIGESFFESLLFLCIWGPSVLFLDILTVDGI